MSPPLRIAVGNNKGGVGKTTTTVNLARAAARSGHRVLLVDGDPQGNASNYLTGYSTDELESLPVWATVLSGEHDIIEAILTPATAAHSTLDEATRHEWQGIDLLPSSRRSASLDKALDPTDLWVERDALDKVADRYDLILIDCPPHLGSITLSHLYAVDRAIIVTEAARWGLDGISEFAKTIVKVARSNRGLHLAGIVLNKVDLRQTAQREYAEYVRDQLGTKILEPAIPDRAVFRRAEATYLPVAALREPEARTVAGLYDHLLHNLTNGGR